MTDETDISATNWMWPAPASGVLVGWVFLLDGIQKFLFPAAHGAGRFEKLGIPAPRFMGPFVGATEIVCGTLLILGLFAIFAVWPLLPLSWLRLPQPRVHCSSSRRFGLPCTRDAE